MGGSGVNAPAGNLPLSVANPITGGTNSYNTSQGPLGVANGNLIAAGAGALPVFSNLANNANTAAGNTQTNFSQYTPTLNTNFSAAPGGLDDFSKGLVSQGTQAINGQVAGQQASIRNQFGASPIANVLSRQAAMTGKLQTNPLLFQAGANQIDRVNNAQTLSNNAKVSQQEASTNGANAGNNAVAQQFSLSAVPAQAYGNLLQTLQGLASNFK